jgi:ethanolamine utilization protein EutA
VLSRLTIRRRGSGLSTEFVVAARETRYASPPLLTPYSTTTRIDVAAVERFVQDCYAAAGTDPAEVDTGVVVVTGEALNKENAPLIAEMLARWSGEFICVSAGPHHEGVLAAHGSGGVALSRPSKTVLNVDMGGGTTKVSLVRAGTIQHVEAFSVGARLIAFDDAGTVVRMEPPGRALCAAAGVTLELGERITADQIDRIAAVMADVVMDAMRPGPAGVLRRELMVTDATRPSPQHRQDVDCIVFSGGVSEYLGGRDDTSYGDLGPALGRHLAARLAAAGLSRRVVPAAHGIRATVLGASQFTVQASGQTSYVPDLELLPVRSLPVVQVELRPGTDASEALRAAMRLRDLDHRTDPVAISVRFRGPRSYPALREHAQSLAQRGGDAPLVVVMKDDLARAFGRIIDVELGYPGPLLVLDGIDVGDLDFLDIGRPLGQTQSFPVTVKSLTFPAPTTASTQLR